MNSKTNTWIDFTRVLMQRAITCGELNGSKVTIDRSALIEFPSEDGSFVDGDNDAIYLTNGDLRITNSVIGFTKDDGVDSGANGGDNPYTAAVDVTPFVKPNNWYEGTFMKVIRYPALATCRIPAVFSSIAAREWKRVTALPPPRRSQ
jgi:hypothetical protein